MKSKVLPILYKKTNTGAIQFWRVGVKEVPEGGLVATQFGQKGTDKPQTTKDVIKVGKNIGRSNETTPYEQALLQAQQQWEKKVKSGYVENLEHAEKGINDLGGIKPMLAQVFEDRIKDIKFPVMLQAKLDGMRCIAVCIGGKISLWSRTQKPILTVPHIIEQLKDVCDLFGEDWILDGELYSHKHKDNFNYLMSVLKRDEVHEDSKVIEYHIYDFPSLQKTTSDRLWKILEIVALGKEHLKVVEAVQADDMDYIERALDDYLHEGFEGLMVRTEGPYEFKRSKHLLKYKKFTDAEFKVVGFDEGKGKLMGSVGSFVCLLPDGRKFNAKMEGELSNLKEMFQNFETKYNGRMLKVRFFQLTPDGVPRFPVGVYFRDSEDI